MSTRLLEKWERYGLSEYHKKEMRRKEAQRQWKKLWEKKKVKECIDWKNKTVTYKEV